MSDMEQKPLVPKLRFPEFRESGEWEYDKLISIAQRITQRNVGSEISRVLTNSAEFGVVDQKDFFDKDIANRNNLENYYVVDKGDYVYNPRVSSFAPVGPISKNHIATGVMSPLYTVFRFDDLNNAFYEHYFKASHWHPYLRAVSNTGARHDRMNVSSDDFDALPLPKIDTKEQQKIADCLSSLDELISAQAKKIDGLKAHKKGLMQQLFPAEGQTTPQLRFPKFRESGEWEEKKLGKISEIVRGGSPRPITEFLTKDVDGLNWLKIGDVEKEAKYINSTEEKVISKALSKTREVNPGDLIMSNSMSFGRPYLLKIKTCIHDGWIAVTELRDEVKRGCLYYFILSSSAQKYFQDSAAGGGIKNLNADIIKLLPINFSKDKKEQQKIADCLSSLDELISAHQQKLATLKTHKKGLMQQLFPAMDDAR